MTALLFILLILAEAGFIVSESVRKDNKKEWTLKPYIDPYKPCSGVCF